MRYYTEIDSIVGNLLLTADDQCLTRVCFEVSRNRPPLEDDWKEHPSHPVLKTARHQLEEYFAGKRRTFDLPLGPQGTPFQQSVWNALRTIPYGETQSYGDIARAIGKPKAVRAVGAANGANPLPIVVPCHRVVGADGSLTGFGGGLPHKKRLLALERH